jgi:hypothetical protein
MTSHRNDSTLKGVIKLQCNKFSDPRLYVGGKLSPRAKLRALSYFAEEVLFSVFRAESGTHMFLALAVWRTPLGVDGGENVKTVLTPNSTKIVQTGPNTV